MPDEYASRLQHARKFTNHAQVVRRMRKEAERGKEIQHRIEPPGPPSRQLAHVASSVSERASCTAPTRLRQQFRRVIETVRIIPSFRKQMRVTTLTTWHVEDA